MAKIRLPITPISPAVWQLWNQAFKRQKFHLNVPNTTGSLPLLLLRRLIVQKYSLIVPHPISECMLEPYRKAHPARSKTCRPIGLSTTLIFYLTAPRWKSEKSYILTTLSIPVHTKANLTSCNYECLAPFSNISAVHFEELKTVRRFSQHIKPHALARQRLSAYYFCLSKVPPSNGSSRGALLTSPHLPHGFSG